MEGRPGVAGDSSRRRARWRVVVVVVAAAAAEGTAERVRGVCEDGSVGGKAVEHVRCLEKGPKERYVQRWRSSVGGR